MPSNLPPNLPLVLAIDTTTGPCSVALARAGKILAERREERPHQQAAQLVPMIEAALAEAGLAYAELDRLAVTTGPGSFTGLRIGLAVAKGLALALDKPLFGFTSLQIMALEAAMRFPAPHEILAAMIGGKGQVFFQHFGADGMHPRGEAEAIAIDALSARLPPGDYTVCGSAQELLAAHASPACRLQQTDILRPSATMLARHAATSESLPAEAVYLREADAKLPAPRF